jgi:hypothetical protein
MGFCAHFREARAINKERKNFYAQMTNGKSRYVSNLLIFWERILFPVASYFDWRAVKFVSTGIITNDFVSLSSLKGPETPPRFQNILSFNQIWILTGQMYRLRKVCYKHLAKYQFEEVHQELCKNIETLSQHEKSFEAHIALLKHICESAAFAAKNAVEYTKTNDVKVKRLASLFIKAQLLGTILSPLVDRSASKLHKYGVGIVVNDLPDIPYQRLVYDDLLKVV